jgi:soluble lytic murein transglycosylase-like protein
MSRSGLIALLSLAVLLPARATATPPATVCGDAAAVAERNWMLPPDLVSAIGRVESGRFDPVTGQLSPWPWTVNANGSGSYFATRMQAVEFVRALQARGVRLIDVGCFQVDLFYHSAAFGSLEEAFDPANNADYAARFLTVLHAQTGNWPAAVARYHSGLTLEGKTYSLKVMSQWGSGGIVGLSNPASARQGLVRVGSNDRYVILMSAAARAIHIFSPSPQRR